MPIVLNVSCMTTVNVIDTAADVALSTGELVVNTIDTITPDISSDD